MLIKNKNRKQVSSYGQFGCRGFIAVTAVTMLACATLLFANIMLQAVVDYSDMVTRHEWRIQANLNAESCLNAVSLMSVKDYFLHGQVYLKEFDCYAEITRDYSTDDSAKKNLISTKTTFNGVNSSEHNRVLFSIH